MYRITHRFFVLVFVLSLLLSHKAIAKRESFFTPDNGIVKGISFGAKGLFALGSVEDAQRPERAQSPAGFTVFSLFPLTEKTQLRVRAGIPLWHVNGTTVTEDEWDEGYYTEVTVDKKGPDPYFSIEHAWGWKGIGFSLGVAYMFLQEYTRDILEYDEWSSYDTTYHHYEYDRNHLFNIVCSIRGGRTKGGFFGMVSFPLAITMDKDRANYLLEYSLFGVFGVKKTKFGIGHMGMIKKREEDSVSVTGTGYPSSYDSREVYMLFPCLKVAQLFGDHVVVNLNFEIGGTIMPRLGSETEGLRPSIGVDFLFSFGTLDGPNVMDGTF